MIKLLINCRHWYSSHWTSSFCYIHSTNAVRQAQLELKRSDGLSSSFAVISSARTLSSIFRRGRDTFLDSTSRHNYRLARAPGTFISLENYAATKINVNTTYTGHAVRGDAVQPNFPNGREREQESEDAYLLFNLYFFFRLGQWERWFDDSLKFIWLNFVLAPIGTVHFGTRLLPCHSLRVYLRRILSNRRHVNEKWNTILKNSCNRNLISLIMCAANVLPFEQCLHNWKTLNDKVKKKCLVVVKITTAKVPCEYHRKYLSRWSSNPNE